MLKLFHHYAGIISDWAVNWRSGKALSSGGLAWLIVDGQRLCLRPIAGHRRTTPLGLNWRCSARK
ncbi:MAG: hypothetical protein GDA56_12260 [Hormoscilla sp. GM7CHS1pb]|nr:hypothetical protein [Hormoscilla sp. GM7CHS1pb]